MRIVVEMDDRVRAMGSVLLLTNLPLYGALEQYLRKRKAGEYAGLCKFLPEIERSLGSSVS
jgi:hypothetical protein